MYCSVGGTLGGQKWRQGAPLTDGHSAAQAAGPRVGAVDSWEVGTEKGSGIWWWSGWGLKNGGDGRWLFWKLTNPPGSSL